MSLSGLTVTGQLYIRLFDEAVKGPAPEVNYEVWNRIFNGVPENYKLPDMAVITFIPAANP
jgi:hypothetical protein